MQFKPLIFADKNVESSDAVLAEVTIKRCAGNRDGIFEFGRFPLAWISGSMELFRLR